MYVVQSKDTQHIANIVDCLEHNQHGTFHLTHEALTFNPTPYNKPTLYIKHNEEEFEYTQHIGLVNNLYVIGGGHCALAFSKIMSLMDFYIRVYDDRPNLNTMEQNTFAHEKFVLDNYQQLSDIIPSGQNNYVVVMTFGYRTDDIAVRALMNKDFKYFGLLGSKKKIEKMFSDYRAEGIPEERLQKIVAPIGVFIKSETPEEIAISIAAEIIRVKNIGMVSLAS